MSLSSNSETSSEAALGLSVYILGYAFVIIYTGCTDSVGLVTDLYVKYLEVLGVFFSHCVDNLIEWVYTSHSVPPPRETCTQVWLLPYITPKPHGKVHPHFDISFYPK